MWQGSVDVARQAPGKAGSKDQPNLGPHLSASGRASDCPSALKSRSQYCSWRTCCVGASKGTRLARWRKHVHAPPHQTRLKATRPGCAAASNAKQVLTAGATSSRPAHQPKLDS